MTTNMKHDGNMKHDARPSREWLRRTAEAEDRCESVTAGGLAGDLGVLESAAPLLESPRVFGRLIEFARRSDGLSLERLAEEADVALAELVAVEAAAKTPSPRTVFQLAKVLRLSTGKLMELAGLGESKDQSLSEAALRFAARSEPTAELSPEQRKAFEEFVKVLVEASDGG